MEEKITIIEGPPPTFETVSDGWAMGLNDSSILNDVVLTRLRTFNGPALVERCYRAWNKQQTIVLEFKNNTGLARKAPIVAARHLDVEEGHVLLLWVRIPNPEVELELGYDDDADDSGDSGDDNTFGKPDWQL
jgi:hypothetical protein